MECMGFEPRTVGLKVQMNPLNYGGTLGHPKLGLLFQTMPPTSTPKGELQTIASITYSMVLDVNTIELVGSAPIKVVPD